MNLYKFLLVIFFTANICFAEPENSYRHKDNEFMAWENVNTWGKSDKAMTDYAMQLHLNLVAEGIHPEKNSAIYYTVIDMEMRKQFPNYRWSDYPYISTLNNNVPIRLEQKAQSGDSEAQTLLGKLYEDEMQYPLAVYWTQKAAAQGNTTAQVNLSGLYFYGRGVKQSYVKSIELMQDAANQGFLIAQLYLAVAYGKGNNQVSHDVDVERSIYWLKQAVEQNNAFAQYMLGLAYITGEGIPQNDSKGFALLKKSVEQGHVPALYALGACYALGKGTDVSIEKAYVLFSTSVFFDENVESSLKNKKISEGLLSAESIKALKVDIKNMISMINAAQKKEKHSFFNAIIPEF